MQHKIVNMVDPQSYYNPQPKRSSSSGTLNMIPPWNIHTVKQSMPRSCSNGCSLNWFTPSEFFQFSQLSNQLVSLKNANDVHKSSTWCGLEIKNWIEDQFQSSPKLVGIWTVLRCIFVPWRLWLKLVVSYGMDKLKLGKFLLWRSIWPWMSQSIVPQNNRDLNQGLLHIWPKFGDPSLNGWWVIARTSTWLPHTRTDGHTDRRRQRQYPMAKTGLG